MGKIKGEKVSKKALLLTLLEESVKKFYAEPKCLISRNGMEQASAARIFYYMQNTLFTDPRFVKFRDLFLDSEYNKNGDGQKMLDGIPRHPDLILHNRQYGETSTNTLIIEFKVSDRDIEDDYRKLEGFTNQDGEYKYFLGVSVKLNRNSPKYKYFQNGQERTAAELRNE